MLKEGSVAPAIELLDQNGKKLSLQKYAKRKVLVYFYEFCSAVMVIEYDKILPSWVVMCEGVGPIVVVSLMQSHT